MTNDDDSCADPGLDSCNEACIIHFVFLQPLHMTTIRALKGRFAKNTASLSPTKAV